MNQHGSAGIGPRPCEHGALALADAWIFRSRHLRPMVEVMKKRLSHLRRVTRTARIARCCFSFAIVVAMAGFAQADEFRFVLPQPGGEFEHPPLRALPLSTDKPDDLKEKPVYRGASQRYAQLRYGSPSAARVAVVVDEVSRSEADLYVDANRNRTIEPNELCKGEGGLWRVPLNVEYAEGEVFKRYPRELIFRRGSTGRILSFAAAGYLEGQVELDGGGAEVESAAAAGKSRRVAARRMDGDGNGFFTDPVDRLWIDANGDGAWDPIEEQFLFANILVINDVRYAVRSDEQGSRLALGKLEGTGVLKLVLPKSSASAGGAASEGNGAAKIVDVAATLVGRDGSAIGLRGLDAQATAPIGEYRVSALTAAFEDPHGGQRWTFVFSDTQGGRPQRWQRLDRDAELEIAPLEKFEFIADCDGKTSCRAGEQLSVQPQLYTVDGLLINTCYRGAHDTGRDGPNARISLESSAGVPLESALSGFA